MMSVMTQLSVMSVTERPPMVNRQPTPTPLIQTDTTDNSAHSDNRKAGRTVKVDAQLPKLDSRLHTNSLNSLNGTNGSNGRYPNSSEGSQSNRSNRSKCSDRSDDPADPCPNCGYSLTLRAGTQKCAWQHKQAQATAKKEAGR